MTPRTPQGRKALIAAGLVMALTFAGSVALAAPKSQKAPPLDNGGLAFAELPPQELAAGQCALFLWARTSPPRRFLMATQNPASARVSLDGRTLDLPLSAWDGEAVYGVHETQTFAGEGVTLTVRFTAEERKGLVGGLVVPSASVEYRDAAGWETVIPAAGMIACQPA
ncbi:MAG: hypothetical protein KF842_02320 [Caulobacter sp.]|nr:hypothetical protein [Caulobacter sp.]